MTYKMHMHVLRRPAKAFRCSIGCVTRHWPNRCARIDSAASRASVEPWGAAFDARRTLERDRRRQAGVARILGLAGESRDESE
ncbi:hypothetical protein RZ125_04120 [Burkholderia pseudomallei]|uniref:hypothetical protein n=1 Tax=Burkholderia pseudomallei TaxID=28450 RepID=UPI0029328FC0|nr:hypothetical protein [Burkholderia pseudomallei]MDV2148046.1 hypothetical protein [Burkholderia pseudomallei]